METGLNLSQSYRGLWSTGSLKGPRHIFYGGSTPDVLRVYLSDPKVCDYHSWYKDDATLLTLSDLNLVRLQQSPMCLPAVRLDGWPH